MLAINEIMRTFFLRILFLVMLFTACSNGSDDPKPIEKPDVEKSFYISFRGKIKQSSRATETAFEKGDEISVFAVKPSSEIVLKSQGNYADNVRYTYQGSRFESNSSISIDEDNTDGLAYYAIYPYQINASSAFTFSVKEDQCSHIGYTQSDFCTAYCAPTINKTVDLEFNHRLSNIVIKFYGDNLANKNLQVKLENVFNSCHVDVNANTYTPTGNKKSITMGVESTNTFHAVIIPQSVSKDEIFMTVIMNNEEYKLSLASDMTFKSGKQIVFEYEVKENKIIELNGYINPWNTEDMRLESVVPEEIIEKMEDYIPLYTGVNPPNIVGAYFIDPPVAVYCEDNEFEPGKEVISEYIRFSNQNAKDNTLDYEEYSEGYFTDGIGAYQEGKGAFISGSGNNFTAFFNTVGEDRDSGHVIKFKTALVVSGTKTDTGIKDLYYAFVMVEKEGDKDGYLMDEGIFRVFKDKDGLSVNTQWNTSSNGRSLMSKYLKGMLEK